MGKEEKPYKYVQALLSIEQFREMEEYMRKNGITNRRDWVEEIIMKEVRKDDGKSLPLHT